MDVNVYPYPNPALAERMKSAQMRAVLYEIMEHGQALYREEVARDTGRLATMAHPSTEIGGVLSDRYIGVLTVGPIEYVLPHNFGSSRSEGVTGGENWVHGAQAGEHELNRVLELLTLVEYL